MLERLIVHIGPPKTGSKSIQHGLHLNRQYFAKGGLIYPAGRWHGQLSSWVLEGEPTCDYNIAEQRPNQDENISADDQYVSALKAELSNSEYKYGFLSYEGFSGMPIAAWAKINNFLNDCARKISILVYCRHPQSLAPSILGGYVTTGLTCHSNDLVRHYKSILKPVVKVFGKENVILREFSKEVFYHGDVLLDAVAQLDKKLADEARASGLGEEIRNDRLSYQAFQIAKYLQPQLRLSANSTNRQRYLISLLAIKGDKLQLTKHQVDDVTMYASQHVNYLKKTFDFEFTQPEKIHYYLPGTGLSPETAESIAAALVLAVEKT